MKLNVLIYTALLSLVLTSCYTIKGAESKFDENQQCALFAADYHPNQAAILNTQGYYLPYDTELSVFIDGMGFKVFDNGLVTNVELREFMYPKDSLSIDKMDKFIELGNYNFDFVDGHTGYYHGGIYKVLSDTLIVDQYNSSTENSLHDYWILKTNKYKIINNEILEEIPTGDDEKDKLRREFSGLRVYRFVPATKLPDEFISSVRDPKWMWKNEEDWKGYKKARDEYKKSLWQQTP